MAGINFLFKKSRQSNVGGFHAAYLDQKRPTRRKLGLARTLFSGVSLIFGAVMCYVALHYVPAFTSTHKVLSLSNSDTSAARLKTRNPVQKLLGPYVDAFSIKRTYLRAGQSIQVQYAIPAGASMDLNIVQCKRLWIVEVFQCHTISREHLTVTKAVGTETFRFNAAGFYFFDETVTLGEKGKDYRVVWSRK